MRNKPTQSDVAKLAGVSRATVSYVVNNLQAENAIPRETTERVWSAIRELDYVPNQQAQHLKQQATNRICVILPRLGIPMNDLMLKAIRQLATQAGYSIIIAVGDSNERIIQLLTQVKGGLADAVHLDLSYGVITDTDNILDLMKNIRVPVIVNANVEPTKDFDSYWVTDKVATYDAIQYLIDNGHEHIAFLGHNIAHLDDYGRYQGYVEALSDNGIGLNLSLIRVGIESREHAHTVTQELIYLEQPPTAIFCTADINALTAIATLQQDGLSIPDEVAVIGCGNISEGHFSYPRLTTIGPLNRAFDELATLMMHRLTAEQQLPPQIVQQDWNLIIRDST